MKKFLVLLLASCALSSFSFASAPDCLDILDEIYDCSVQDYPYPCRPGDWEAIERDWAECELQDL
ncbi:hypothetical protein [Acanthopleuribacter pedis]|uniref:Uncharacterized protein n=1 Tax=Acanthopleuribacter pedis TaxID=442870 RepID=A0A8J7U4D7_9BACT|nr:hypothetical protein [Acanthopleuribacter pedis]MBO1320537.1 hypothetical protein [Acanthopleuribacter pedis]